MSQLLYVAEDVKEKLMGLIDEEKTRTIKVSSYIKNLESEIKKAVIVNPKDLPNNVITMNSRINMIVDGIEEEIILVYPEEADFKNNKLSVLSPVGTAILGYSEGSTIEWHIPSGNVQIIINSVKQLKTEEAIR